MTTPLAMAGLSLVLFVPTFYAVDMGLGLGVVGAVFVFGRLFDVVTDPLVGRWSDETRSRFGPRRPWIVVGVPLFCAAVWALFSPPESAGLVYLICASGLFFLLYTIVDVPYSSIGLEISPHVHERTFLASSKAAFQVVGAIAAAAIPFALALAIPDALSLIALVIAVLSLIGLMTLMLFVPHANRDVTEPRQNLWAAVKWIFSRSQYRYLLGAFFIVQAANALTAGLLVLYVTHVVEAAALVGAFTIAMFSSSALFLPLWIIVSKRRSKKAAWMTAITVCIVALGLIPFVGPGDTLAFTMLAIAIGATFGADAVMPTSMLADIVHAGETSGRNRFAGTYLAVKNAVSKMTFVVPMGLAFPVLELVGFDGKATNGQTELAFLVGFFAILPLILRLVALGVLSRAPVYFDAEPTIHHG